MKRKVRTGSKDAGPANRSEFSGFSPETLRFLKNLSGNNSKAWFESHRGDYEQYLLGPLKSLVAELGPFMLTIDPQFEVTPAVDKTVSRIYRDTRFSKDKSLFKSNMWITFKRPGKDWKESPAYFFEISTGWYRYGMGFYSASRQTMTNLREFIVDNPRDFGHIVKGYQAQRTFELRGEEYKRVADVSINPDFEEWYRKKNMYFIRDCEPGRHLFSRRIAGDLKRGFGVLAELYHFFLRIRAEV